MRQHTSAYAAPRTVSLALQRRVSMRQHTSACVSIRSATYCMPGSAEKAQHASAYVSIRQHTQRHVLYVWLCREERDEGRRVSVARGLVNSVSSVARGFVNSV
jgi:hypothetical protein